MTSTETTISVTIITSARSNPRVSGGDHDADALHAELHELVALSLLVVGWQIVFLSAIADADDVCWLVNTWGVPSEKMSHQEGV